MLMLGMPENVVRKISGHSASSRAFYRYVSFSQGYLDQEIDKVYKKLNAMS
jgi:intergrase/recombinase